MKKFLAFFLILATVILPIVSSFAASCAHNVGGEFIRIIKEGSCQVRPLGEYRCYKCSEIYQQHTNYLGHDYAPADCVNPQKCKTSGCHATQGTPLGHDPTPATCISPIGCRRIGCNYTKGGLGNHSYTKPSCKIPSTCRYCHDEKGDLLPHDFAGATCGKRGTCRACGAQGPYKPHEYVNGKCTMCKRDEPFLNDVPSTTDPT